MVTLLYTLMITLVATQKATQIRSLILRFGLILTHVDNTNGIVMCTFYLP